MIKLKQLLLEAKAPSIFIPRRMEDRDERFVRMIERMIKEYVRNGSKGDLDLTGVKFNKLPEILKNIDVGGDFYCSDTNLISLKNSPKKIKGNFFCVSNKLLTSLDGSPTNVRGNFICDDNVNLTSLHGMPKKIGGNVYCMHNGKNFTYWDFQKVTDVKGYIKTSTESGL